MSALLQTMHNQRIPPMPGPNRQLYWLAMGTGLQLAPGRVLYAFRERQIGEFAATLLLVIHLKGGNVLAARDPEGLNLICTDAVVRCVESDARGPVRVLIEVGDMVAFPSLRECAA